MSFESIDSAFDAKVVAQIAAGDPKAVGKLFDRYAPMAFNLSARILRDTAQAEEILQEVFLWAWREAAIFDPAREEAKTWLAEMTRSLAEGRLRPEERGREQDEAPELALPEGLKEKIMAQFQSVKPQPAPTAPRRERPAPAKWGWIWITLVFGFGLAASAAAIYSGFQANKLEKEIQKHTAEIAGLRQQLTSTQAQLAFTLSPINAMVELAGQRINPEARGKVIYNAQGEGVFTAAGLPPADSGKTYQLWVFAGGQPVSVKVFDVGSGGAVKFKMAGLPPAEQISSFAVTLEPAGGVPLPSGEKYLLGF